MALSLSHSLRELEFFLEPSLELLLLSLRLLLSFLLLPCLESLLLFDSVSLCGDMGCGGRGGTFVSLSEPELMEL